MAKTPSNPLRRPRIVMDEQHVRAGRKRYFWLGLFLGLALGVGAALVWEQQTVTPNRSGDAALDDAYADAKDELAKVRQELAVAQRSEQVTQAANGVLRQDLDSLELRIAELTEDLEFYQQLLDQGGRARGLLVHAVDIFPTESSRVYRYRLTLSQNLRRAETIEGTYTIGLQGVQGNTGQLLRASALQMTPSADEPEFSFKYFEQVSGLVTLPEGFTPEEIVVSLDPSTRNRKSVEHRLAWGEALRSR